MITLVSICTHFYLEKRNAYVLEIFYKLSAILFPGETECGWVLKIWNWTLESRGPFPSVLQMDGIRILEKQFQGSHGCTNRILKKISSSLEIKYSRRLCNASKEIRGARCFNGQQYRMSNSPCVDRGKTVDLVTVPLDVLPEGCTLTMLPEV